MKRVFLVLVAAAVVAAAPLIALAADGSSHNFEVNNRFRIGYDDNIYESKDDATDSFKLIEEVELLVNFNLEQSYVGLRYRPTYQYVADREPDDSDFHHDFNIVVTHEFTPRLSLSAKDTFIISEQPQLMDRGAVIRENGDYSYNVADGTVVYLLKPETRIDVGGRYTLLRYDDDVVSETEDFDIYAVGASIRQQLSGTSAAALEYRREDVQYEGPDRGSVSDFAGVSVEQAFNPNLVAVARAGYQMKSFEDDAIDDSTAPYGDVSVTLMPSPATRITAGAGYSMYESDVFPYANQDRTTMFLSLAHDLTARVSCYLSGTYYMGEYDKSEAIAPVASDGEEDVSQLGARVSYKVNRSNWLEAGWQYLNLSSDVREEFDRNRLELGWRTSI
jgi:hypothetical protein